MTILIDYITIKTKNVFESYLIIIYNKRTKEKSNLQYVPILSNCALNFSVNYI